MLVPDELYSKLVRNGAVIHMKNTCSPTPRDVKISTPDWAVEAAAAIGAEMTGRIEATGVRVIGDPGLLSAVPELVPRSVEEPRIAPEVAAQALYGALVAVAAGAGGGAARPVHRTSSKELVKALGTAVSSGCDAAEPHSRHSRQSHTVCGVTHRI
jgi:hypothetical protein